MNVSTEKILFRSLSTLALIVLSVLFIVPFVWMFFGTFKTDDEIFSIFPILPKKFHFQYYFELLSGDHIPYPRQFFNSVYIALGQTVGALISSLTAAFVFSHYRFPGSRFLYALALLMILIPRQILVVPLFSWMHNLNLLDQGIGVILPGVISGIGVLFFTQMYKNIPRELPEVARIEGASEYRIFFLILPLMKPAIWTYGLIHFILAWHEHLIPLVFLSSREQLTVSVALASLYSSSLNFNYALLMVGASLSVIPTVIFYLLVQKHLESALSELTLQ